MASGKSSVRTYVRKSRTGTAEEKYDALFGSKTQTSSSLERKDDAKRRRIAVSGKTERSKYDRMFEESEKSASEKFDAIFADSEHIPSSKQVSRKNKWSTDNQSKVIDDLSSFNTWEDQSNSQDTQNHSNDAKPTSPKKLPHITHASMVKLGGRLVLNIQRGGNSNSLAEKGGTLLLAANKSRGFSSAISPTKNTPNSNSPAPANDDFDAFVFGQSKSSTVDIKSSAPTIPRSNSLTPTKKLLGSTKNKISKSSAFYNSRPWSSDSQFPSNKPKPREPCFSSSQPILPSEVYKEPTTDDVIKPTKSASLPKTFGVHLVKKIKCEKDQAKYFTVVKHVKNYQNCLEEGEIQEFEDDLEYLRGGLNSDQPNSVRCLSVTSLACKCEQQNFRLYLRAHNVLLKVFEMLQDADQNKALALATSSLLYMLSRDRQIGIDKVTLKILLKLVDPLDNRPKDKPSSEGKAAPKTKFSKIYRHKKSPKSTHDEEEETVQGKIKDLIDRCGDPLVTSNDLTTKVLASEALLRYTARRTGDWYREEIRLKGGLDHVISLVKSQVDIVEELPDQLDDDQFLSQIERPLCILERLLRVLENSIVNSARNAMYLVTHQRALLLRKISMLMSKCSSWLHRMDETSLSETKTNKSSLLVKNVISQIMKLLVNISNDSEWSSSRIGDQENLLSCVLVNILSPKLINEDHKYEITLLSLGLLVNLVESSAKNRLKIMQMKTASMHEHVTDSVPVIDALVELFVDREIAARQNEILGEEGVKKATEAKKKHQNASDQGSVGLDADDEGYWVENEDGMVWVALETNDKTDDNDIPGSQGSLASLGDPQSIESKLTPEQKAEMEDALNKANDHMEASIIASYTALVLGCLIQGNIRNADMVRAKLPGDGELTSMITMLKKFSSFMNLTRGMSKKGAEKLVQVIEEMEKVDVRQPKSFA